MANAAGARLFGVGGLYGGSLRATVGTSVWGSSLSGTAVNSQASFNAAVAQLRSVNGRSPSASGVWTNPPQWARVEAALATTDDSEPSEEIDGNPNATVASLAALGIVPLAVTQIGCSSFDFTVDSPAQGAAAYWGERWELYKRA